MKGLIVSVAGLGLGGAAYFGTDGPDFDEVVNKRPNEVYSAFSALAPEGTITQPASDAMDRAMTLRVTKESGESIRYEILFDDRPVVTADLAFEAGGEGGQGTRMTAELELDEFELGSAFETEAGVALSMVPETFVDMQFAGFIRDMVRDVEAGRPLPPLGLDRAGVRRHESGTSAERRYEQERARRAAAAPMSRPVPMVDPNKAAENYRNGVSDEMGRADGWGR